MTTSQYIRLTTPNSALAFLVTIALLLFGGNCLRAETPPNIIFILTDDQGYGDMSCHGNPILETPNIDKLHGESLRFTNFHVNPVCAPSRGAMMTGLYPTRAGSRGNFMNLECVYPDRRMMPEAFKSAGYATAMFGKWHLGDNYPFRPEDRGFDEVVRHGGGGIGQTPDVWDNAYFDDRYFHNGKVEQYQGYCTDVFFKEAKRFILECISKGKPFFVYLSPNAPHGPMHCPQEYWEPYVAKIEQLPLYREKRARVPAEKLAIFYGMIQNIDENVGLLRDLLKEKGLEENTAVIFGTDNGSATGYEVSNGGMRGKKGNLYEGGHRVPLFVHWPGGGLDQGRDVDQLAAHIDLLPTFIDLFGLKGFGKDYALDGRSLEPLIRNPEGEWPQRTIFSDLQGLVPRRMWRSSAVMRDQWRLVNGEELYDLASDPGQKEDVAGEHPEVVTELRSAYEEWHQGFEPSWDRISRVVVGNPAGNPTTLSAYGCHRNGVLPLTHGMIRRASVAFGTGWHIHVETAGEYRLTLRRWPREADREISGTLPSGDPVEGDKAGREQPGIELKVVKAGVKIGDQVFEKEVSRDKKGIPFELELEAGDTILDAWFDLEEPVGRGKDQQGRVTAYYVEMEKIPAP